MAVSERNDVYFPFAEPKTCLDSLDEARPVFFADRDAVLNNLDARAEPFDLRFGIHADNFIVDPHAQIALLLEKIEERARFRSRRNGNPKGDENRFFVILSPSILLRTRSAKRSRRICRISFPRRRNYRFFDCVFLRKISLRMTRS